MLMMPYLADGGTVVDFQNGVNDERVAAIAGTERTMGAVITIGAGCYDPGKVVRTDSNPVGFKVGELDGSDSERAHELASIMSHVENTEVTTDLIGDPALVEADHQQYEQRRRRSYRSRGRRGPDCF